MTAIIKNWTLRHQQTRNNQTNNKQVNIVMTIQLTRSCRSLTDSNVSAVTTYKIGCYDNEFWNDLNFQETNRWFVRFYKLNVYYICIQSELLIQVKDPFLLTPFQCRVITVYKNRDDRSNNFRDSAFVMFLVFLHLIK